MSHLPKISVFLTFTLPQFVISVPFPFLQIRDQTYGVQDGQKTNSSTRSCRPPRTPNRPYHTKGHPKIIMPNRTISGISFPQPWTLRAGGKPWLTRSRSILILAASVPSSGWAVSLNHGCCKACLAVIRLTGSYTKIFFRRSLKFFKKGVLLGIIS